MIAILSNDQDIGHELATGLLVDTVTGCPIAPIEQRLLAKDAVHSSRRPGETLARSTPTSSTPLGSCGG